VLEMRLLEAFMECVYGMRLSNAFKSSSNYVK
jgi:hypothetical protein